MNVQGKQKVSKEIFPLRQAASMILFQNPVDPKNLLMFKRIAKISFGSAVVFPGGACDKQEKQYTSKIMGSDRFEDYSKISAVRQLLEETGILLVPDRSHPALQKILSGNLTNKDFTHDFLCNLWKGHLKLIIPLIRLLTVQMLPGKRFDTVFYTPHPQVVRLNLNSLLGGNPENLQNLKMSGQGQNYFWLSADSFLNKYYDNQISLVPPQIIIIKCLKNLKSFDQLLSLNAKNCYEPILMHTNNFKLFTLFGDESYNFQQLKAKQPESLPKNNFVKYFQEQIKQDIHQDNSPKLRRFSIDMKQKTLFFQTYFVEKSLLAFLQNSPQL